MDVHISKRTLTHLTKLNLSWCKNLISLPLSLHHLTHLTAPLCIAGGLPLPSDLDWSEFTKEVSVPLYLDYMMRRNKIDSIFDSLLKYMKRFDADDYYFKGYRISELFGLIARRREGGADFIGYITSMLTNGGMKRGSGYGNRIRQWTKKEKKRCGINWLNILYLDIYGMDRDRWSDENIARRMKEVGKDEGKEDEEGRREWERRWREGRDIMEEEDVMEVAVMHLCIPNRYTWDGLIVPTDCSYTALSIFLNENAKRLTLYHFPAYNIKNQPSNVVIIRNLPRYFSEYSKYWNTFRTLLISICPFVSIDRDRSEYGVVRVRVKNSSDARMLKDGISGCAFVGKQLSASVNVEKSKEEAEEEDGE